MFNLNDYLTVSNSSVLTSICRTIRKDPFLSALIAVAAISSVYALSRQSNLRLSHEIIPVTPESVDTPMQQSVSGIVHLAQCHWHKDYDGPTSEQQIWHSQKTIAKYLLAHPNAIIFDEGTTETTTSTSHNPSRALKAMFEKSLKNLDTLDAGLKDDLMQAGSANFLCYMGKVNQVRRAISKERKVEIDSEIQKEHQLGNLNPYSDKLKPLLFDQREQELVNEVRQFLHTTTENNPEIVVIYGAGHDFSKYFADQNFTRIDTRLEGPNLL